MNDLYALINSEGIVVNIIEWDGTGDLFADFQTYKLSDSDFVGPGYIAVKKGSKWIFSMPDEPVSE